MTAVAILHREEILLETEQGTYLEIIARRLGVTDGAISQHLSKDPEYLAARERGMERRLDTSLMRVEAAGDDLNLARAREIVLRRLEWRAEREFGHRWGAKTELKITRGDGLDAKLRAAEERLIGSGSTEAAQQLANSDGATASQRNDNLLQVAEKK